MPRYKGQVIADYGLVNINNRASRIQMAHALTSYMRAPLHPAVKKVAQAFQGARTGDKSQDIKLMSALSAQAFATSANDFPASVVEVLAKYQQLAYYDTAYEQVFNMIDMRGSNRASFDILDVEDGLAFSKVEIGEKAKIYKMSGEKTSVPVSLYGGGLGWSKLLFDDEEYWTLENMAIAFRNSAIESKSQDFYDLIEGSAATYDLAWQAVSPAGVTNANENYNAIRDINTINKACENILTACKGLGFGVNPSTQFVILAPHQLVGRISQALNIVLQPFRESTPRITYNVQPYYTLMFTATDKYYVCLPKNKIMGATRKDLEVLFKDDIEAYTEIAVGWQRYGGAIGEAKQISRCSTA